MSILHHQEGFSWMLQTQYSASAMGKLAKTQGPKAMITACVASCQSNRLEKAREPAAIPRLSETYPQAIATQTLLRGIV